MPGNRFRSAPVWASAFFAATLLTTGCGTNAIPLLPETTVANLPSEDLAGPCTYAMRLVEGPVVTPGQPATQIPQTGVLVVFERGDSLSLFEDPAVIATAQQLHLAMMYAYQCNAASFNDLQSNAGAGPGRALFQALNQFAVSLKHPELGNANVFLTGFSAAGFLSVTTARDFPGRVLGTIPYAPASAYADLNQIQVSAALAQIPSLILVSGKDVAAGDQLPFFLFLRGWEQGAPWGFASQRAVNHCCVDSIAPLLIPWITAVFHKDTTAGPNGLVSLNSGISPVAPSVAFEITVDGSFDPLGFQNFYLGSYSILPATSGGPFEAWLPDAATTQAWVSWITNPN